ncbi:MAG TPA: hypothetical protein VMF52_18295 [Steroidobacteraceae bacterium]|nr:hypothetical protein [Steroidobacteraceae bacterium]
MRAIAGPAMLLVVVLSFTGYKLLRKPDSPPRSFTDLELAGPAPDDAATCYALSTVLVANGVFGNVPRTWTAAGKDEWTLTIERVIDGRNGPERDYVAWTFEKHGATVRLTKAEGAPGRPQTVPAALDELLIAPNARHSTPVERCVPPGATGYLFKRK